MVHSSIPYQRHQKKQRLHQKEITSFNFTDFKGKPFWIWDREEHLRLAEETNEQCCFNHIVGLPVKGKVEHPIYDYEKILYDSLMPQSGHFTDKHLWIKKSPSFGREYDLQYLGLIGNTFHSVDIERAIALGKRYKDKTPNKYAQQSMGIDPGFGSSPFGIVIIQFSDGVLQVLYADEFERPRYEDMINKVSNLYSEFTNIKNIFVDAANPELISSLKREVANERDNWQWVQEKMAYCKKHHVDINRHMKVVPVPFSTEGKNMLIHTKELLEFETPIVAINPKFEKLTTSLRTAISDDLGKLDKEATSYDNVLDAFRLSLQMFKLKEKERDTVLYAMID